KLAARIEQAINEVQTLPPDAIYISGSKADVFFPWDLFVSEDLNAVYGREMDILPSARAVPEKSVVLRSVFEAYRFILSNLELAPNTLYPDAVKKLQTIEKQLYTDPQRSKRTTEYQFFIEAKKELESVELELKDIPPAKLTSLQKVKLSQARKKVSVDANGDLYTSLEIQLS